MEPVGIFKIARKMVHIFKGWARRFRLIETTDELKQLSEYRLGVCKQNDGICSKKIKVLEILNGDAEYVNSLICTKCGCPCLEKSLVAEEYCPLHKWKQ